MSKLAVKTNYSKVTDNKLGPFSLSVYDALNPNEHFTWEVSVMPDFLAKINKYNKAVEKAINGKPSDTLAKNTARAALIEELKMIASEVNRQSNKDLVVLQSSGLTLMKERTKIGILPKPASFTVKTGDNSGDFLCLTSSNAHAFMYNFYSAPVPAPANIAEWRLTPSSIRKINISGFIPGVQYELKCAYQGSESQLIFSDSVSIFAQ